MKLKLVCILQEVGEAFLANRGLMELVQRIRGDNRLLDK